MSELELNVVLRGIKQLITPATEGTTILHSLDRSLDSFELFLRDSSPAQLGIALQSTVESLEIPQCDVENSSESRKDDISLYCRFTVQSLALLCLLDKSLKSAHASDQATVRKQSSLSSKDKNISPPTPKALLSSAEEKNIRVLLQFVLALGVFPFLLPGADHLLRLKLGKMASQISKSGGDDVTPCNNNLSRRACYLYHHCRVLTRMFANPVIGPTILTHHLSTVLVALLQICYGPRETPQQQQQQSLRQRTQQDERKSPLVSVDQTFPVLSAAQFQKCAEELRTLLDGLHQPLVVRELLYLQGTPGRQSRVGERGDRGRGETVRPAAPRWLQNACGQLLSERLMQRDGVCNVLLGIYDMIPGCEGVGSGCQGDWKRVQAVARIISCCPSQASSHTDYYSSIAPQLLQLLNSPPLASSVQVTAATISIMLRQQPALARAHLLIPLTQPLRLLTTGGFPDQILPGDINKDIEMSIKSLHRLCDSVEPSSPVMRAIQPFLPVLFEVWRACTSSEAKSCGELRSELTSLLIHVFDSLESSTMIEFLRHLAGLPPAPQGTIEWLSFSTGVNVEYSSEGGGLLVRSCEMGEGWSVERMENMGHAILELTGTELKSSRLLGPFFLECVSHVAAVLCLDIDYQPQLASVQEEMKQISQVGVKSTKPSGTTSSLLLDIEKRMVEPTPAETYQRSLALYIIAAISESMTSEVLEQADIAKLLSVLSVVIECHAHLVTRKSDACSSSPVDLLMTQPDLDRMLGGPITLSIALGYLSAVLAGTRQLEKGHRSLVSGLLSPLEMIANGYPDPELNALAGDLRVCIATLGAVWSTELKQAAAEGRGRLKRKGETTGVVSSGPQEEFQTNHEMVNVRNGSDETKHTLVEEISVGLDSTALPHGKENDSITQTAFQQALTEVQDLEIPVKGHGLSSLARLLETGDEETVANSIHLLEIFKDNLSHPDSYVYLAAIKGLVNLASKQRLKVLHILCEGYAMFSKPQNGDGVDKETGQYKNRTKILETKGKSREKDYEKYTKDSLELRLKLGEALVHVARDCGEMLPHYADRLLAAVLSNARDSHPLIRASALSNLAEICQLLGHSFGNTHHEILSCVTQLLQSDSTPQVQQAALLVISLLLKGLSHHTVHILEDSLRDVYRLLKCVEGERERDDLTRAHAQAALGQLDSVMKDWVFPQQKLTKNITIL